MIDGRWKRLREAAPKYGRHVIVYESGEAADVRVVYLAYSGIDGPGSGTGHDVWVDADTESDVADSDDWWIELPERGR